MLKSKEFWIAVVDAVVSLTTYFVTKYAAPGIAEDVSQVILIVQPLVLAIIGGMLAERVKVAVSDLKATLLYKTR